MKILYLCIDPGIDVNGYKGGSVHIRSLVRALSDLGHEVTLVGSTISSPERLAKELRVDVRPAPVGRSNRALGWFIKNADRVLGMHPRRNPDLVRVLHNRQFFRIAKKAAREIKPDFIYERYSLWGWAGMRLADQLSLPHVLEVNAPLAYEQQRRAGLTLPAVAHRVERKIWRSADTLVAVSEELRRDLEAAGVAPERLHVLPNAVDLSLFRNDLSPAPTRKKLGLDGLFVIGFVGSFKPWHGVDLLLSAFRELHREDPRTHLLLVGQGQLLVPMRQEVERSGLKRAVTFLGSVPHQEVPGYIAAMDVAVAPTPALDHFYYSPLKIFEYLAMGRPVVASRIGQVTKLIQDGVTGLFFTPGDVGSLVQQIRRLKLDPALRKELGNRASIAGVTQTWNSNAVRLLQWVRPLLAPQASPDFSPSVAMRDSSGGQKALPRTVSAHLHFNSSEDAAGKVLSNGSKERE